MAGQGRLWEEAEAVRSNLCLSKGGVTPYRSPGRIARFRNYPAFQAGRMIGSPEAGLMNHTEVVEFHDWLATG